MIGNYQGFLLTLLNFLRIPPGIQVRKSYGANKDASTDWYEKTLASHDFINTIVDITADDVCIGNSPIYIENLDKVISPEQKEAYQKVVKAANKIAKWVAVDLLKRGYSLYAFRQFEVKVDTFVGGKKLETTETRQRLVPVLEEASFYMDEDGKIYVYVEDNLRDDLLVFLNFSKETLILNKDTDFNSQDPRSSYKFIINPEPVQLKHVQTVATDLYMVERAMYRYRVQLSKIVRFAEVEVGISQGGENNDLVVDNASAAVNANSMSLGMSSSDPVMNFDDNLPINPIRKGAGHIDVISDIPDFDKIKELPDLDYTINRLFLAMRFPKSYADFGTALNETAVSLIRGDIRYSRMVANCRSIMQDTLNAWIFGDDYDPMDDAVQVKLTALPTSEDDDVIEALSKQSDFTQEVFQFLGDSESKEEANAKLQSISILLGDSTSQKSIQKWIQFMKDYINDKWSEDEQEEDIPAESDEDPFDLSSVGESKETPSSESEDERSEGSEQAPKPAQTGEPPEAFGLPPINE